MERSQKSNVKWKMLKGKRWLKGEERRLIRIINSELRYKIIRQQKRIKNCFNSESQMGDN
jgi:hypothetical protein